MDDPSAPRDRRTVTPAIVASAVFVASCAVFAIAFVGARGGLELPLAPTEPPVALASDSPTESPATPSPAPTFRHPRRPSRRRRLPATTPPTAPPPTRPPATEPAPSPFVVPTLEPGDPLLALPACDDRPGCFEYVVVRFDTLSGIISRYLCSTSTSSKP